MKRRNFLTKSTLGGLTLMSGTFPTNALTPPASPVIWWPWVIRLGKAIATKVIVDTVSDYAKDWLFGEENKKVSTQVQQVITHCKKNEYPIDYTPVQEYSKKNKSFFFSTPTTKNREEKHSQTLFYTNRTPNYQGHCAILRYYELCGMTWFTEQIMKDYLPELVRSVILPEAINVRDFKNHGDLQGGACIYKTNTGRMVIDYDKASAARYNIKCELLPDNPNKHSFNLSEKPITLFTSLDI